MRGQLLVFAATLFWSAALLFCVEPMIARMLLPLLGGAPAVWVACVLFFQVVLLLGYAYAHVVGADPAPTVAAGVHVALVALPLFVLPIAFDSKSTEAWAPEANPTLPLLGLLAVRVGLPFFALSASGPLLQKWFSTLGHPSGKDPYFLYGSSNLGSMLALIAYPAVLEPTMGLSGQSRLWQVGYWGLGALVVTCAVAVFRGHGAAPTPEADAPATDEEAPTQPRRPLLWIALAFVPSSLMLGVTTYVTTDIAPVPLFWVMPLALYLATFILAFARRPVSPRIASRVMPFAVSMVLLAILSELGRPGWLLIGVHLSTFFLVALVCHSALAASRPHARHLTEFYLCLSVGGALGGIFNALVAPLVFNRLYEYPLVIVVACLARAAVREPAQAQVQAQAQTQARRDWFVPVGIGLLTAALALVVQRMGLEAGGPAVGIIFGPALMVNYGGLHRPLRFGLGVAAILLASGLYTRSTGKVLRSERGFFGVVAVSRDPAGLYNQIVHGDTVHGRQKLDPAHRDEPLVYYERTGPVGQVFAQYDEHPATPQVGVIGLGAGALAGYARRGEKWTFYEIDPIVVRVATDGEYFTFLRDMFHEPGALTIELGDGRVRLKAAPDGYGLLVLDAFSSDAIPMHLVTEQALALFFRKLAPDGLLALHVSNRYLDLYPVFADLALAEHLVAFGRRDTSITPEQEADGKLASEWIAMARSEEALGSIASDERWHRLHGREGRRVWTDDYSNLLSVFRW